MTEADEFAPGGAFDEDSNPFSERNSTFLTDADRLHTTGIDRLRVEALLLAQTGYDYEAALTTLTADLGDALRESHHAKEMLGSGISQDLAMEEIVNPDFLTAHQILIDIGIPSLLARVDAWGTDD